MGVREILRLYYNAELSFRQISAGTKINVGSIQHVLKLAEQQNLSWPLRRVDKEFNKVGNYYKYQLYYENQ